MTQLTRSGELRRLPIVFAAAVLLIAGLAASASAQPTAFTYQGLLKNSGSPANGALDMSFTVFDADVDGNLIAGPLTFDGQGGNPPQVNLTDGLFTVNLDFGGGVFDGNPRWLEINVAGTTLTPRQPFTSTPYAQAAIHGQSCGVADYANAPWVPSGADLYYANGNVGIGTSSPTARLEIGGTPGLDGIKFPDGSLQTSAIGAGGGPWQTNGSDVWYGGGGVGVIGGSSPFPSGKGVFLEGGSASTASVFAFNYDNFQPLSLILNSPGGNVGIGTSAPSARLHVAASSGNSIFASTSGGTALAGSATSNFGGTGASGTHVPSGNIGKLGTIDAGVAGTAVIAGNYGGNFVNTDASGVALRSQGLFDIVAGGAGAQLIRFDTERPWILRQVYTGPSAGLQLYSTVGAKNFEITCSTGVNCATFLTLDASPRVGIATTTPGATLDVNGTTRTRVLEITGADVAEKFPTSGGQVEPGTVMEIDPEHPGLLRQARGEYNPRVAGVVSGANNFPAGAILGHMKGFEDAPPIALSGRVWTFCDATAQPIAPGDSLTTSATAGYAMKATDRARSHGAVIGKAMTALKSGRGLVLVLVNLQ